MNRHIQLADSNSPLKFPLELSLNSSQRYQDLLNLSRLRLVVIQSSITAQKAAPRKPGVVPAQQAALRN